MRRRLFRHRGAVPRRVLAALVTVSAVLSLATAHQAAARDLDDRRDRIGQQIDRTKRQLDQSSDRLVAATGCCSRPGRVWLSRARRRRGPAASWPSPGLATPRCGPSSPRPSKSSGGHARSCCGAGPAWRTRRRSSGRSRWRATRAGIPISWRCRWCSTPKTPPSSAFGAACGTPVRAAEGGRVIAVYCHGAYGNRVIVDHGYRRGVGLGTSYNHLSATPRTSDSGCSAGRSSGSWGAPGPRRGVSCTSWSSRTEPP